MYEHFLGLYNDELAALRHQAERFADAYPKVAGRLRLSSDVADDPQTERLLQSFAYSAARIRLKLDDELPELTNELLEVLYPHFLAVIPAMTLVRLQPDPTADCVRIIPRATEIITDPVDGDICRFRTTQRVDLTPVKIDAVELSSEPVTAPLSPFAGVNGCLRISLRVLNRKVTFTQLGIRRLRFYLSAAWSDALTLYELLGNNIAGIGLAAHPTDTRPVFLDKSRLSAVGFAADETTLTYPVTSFTGYRLLAEFFALPQKFLFFEIEDIAGEFQDQLEIYVYLKCSDRKLERSIRADHLELNVTPVVNLFRQTCEPLQIDGTRSEYRLVPDARRHRTREVHMIEDVHLCHPNGEELACAPLFGHRNGADTAQMFWQAKRRAGSAGEMADMELSFVDRDHRTLEEPDLIASVDALCTNGDLPRKLPFGGHQPRLSLVESYGVADIRALIPPTPARRRLDHVGRHWCLLSHLLLNHASLSDGTGAALKEILRLYVTQDMPERRLLIDAIVGLETRRATTCLSNGAVLCGTDLVLEFDAERVDRASAFFFGTIIDRFLALYTSINSYTRLIVRLQGFSQPVASWPPRVAERPLI
jgi:type VI secretion system protein ImpG